MHTSGLTTHRARRHNPHFMKGREASAALLRLVHPWCQQPKKGRTPEQIALDVMVSVTNRQVSQVDGVKPGGRACNA